MKHAKYISKLYRVLMFMTGHDEHIYILTYSDTPNPTLTTIHITHIYCTCYLSIRFPSRAVNVSINYATTCEHTVGSRSMDDQV